MLYSSIVTPYYIAFIDETSHLGFFDIMETLIDFSFIIDILIICNTSFNRTIEEENPTLLKSHCEILRNYAKSWLLIDVLSSVPISLLMFNLQNRVINNAIRPIKFLRLVKLIKFQNSEVVQKATLKLFSHGTTSIALFLVLAILFSHIFSCIWYLFPKLFDSTENWVYQLGHMNKTKFQLYGISFYFSVSTLLTVGIGDVTSFSTIEQLMSIAWMLLGVGFYSFTIGTLSSALAEMNGKEAKLKYKLSILNDFGQAVGLNRELKEKLKKVLIANSSNNAFTWAEKQKLFSGLPITIKVEVRIKINIKTQIAKSMKEGYLRNISFFNSKEDSFVAMIIPFLLPWKIGLNETIYKFNDHPNQGNAI